MGDQGSQDALVFRGLGIAGAPSSLSRTMLRCGLLAAVQNLTLQSVELCTVQSLAWCCTFVASQVLATLCALSQAAIDWSSDCGCAELGSSVRLVTPEPSDKCSEPVQQPVTGSDRLVKQLWLRRARSQCASCHTGAQSQMH